MPAKAFLILAMLTCRAVAAQEKPSGQPPANGRPSGHACDPICNLAKHPLIFSFNKRFHSSYFFNVMLVYDETKQSQPSVSGLKTNYLWTVNACWREDGLIVEVIRAMAKTPLNPKGYTVDSLFKALYHKTLITDDLAQRAIRHVKFGELGFLERDFIESLPLAIMGGSDATAAAHQSNLYFRIIPKGSPGDTLGSYDTSNPGFKELNPGYAKLFDGMEKAAKTIFPAWLAAQDNPPDQPWANSRSFEYACDPISYLAHHPAAFSFNDRHDSSDLFNVMLVYDQTVQSQRTVSELRKNSLWVVNACWREDGLIVEVIRAQAETKLNPKEYTMESLYEALSSNALDTDIAWRTIRHVKFGELKFLERDFIESLPLAIRSKTAVSSFSDFGSWLFFRIDPKGSKFSTLGSYDTSNPGFMELNPGYTQLFDGMDKATKTIFPAWLREESKKNKKSKKNEANEKRLP